MPNLKKLFALRSLLALLMLPAILLTSCVIFGKYTEVEYHNLVVEQVNATSAAIEVSATLYNETVPNIVTEENEIETDDMEDSYKDALSELKSANSLINLESKNADQQDAAQLGIQTYLSSGELYLAAYNDMLTYYGEDVYIEDISQVQTLDEALHMHYATFREANNGLVDILSQFVELEEDEVVQATEE